MRIASPIAALIATTLMHGAVAPAAAVTVDNLYQAKTIVTGTDEASRRPGLVKCLEDVLVKVSGDPRLIGDPATIELTNDVEKYVATFRYRDRLEGFPIHDDQGTYDRPHDLTVDFKPEEIDATLASLGRKPWTADRPRLLVFLGVENAKGTFLLTRDGGQSPYMIDSLAAASERVGMPMAIPDQASLDRAGLTFDKLATTDLATLDGIARRADGDQAIRGRLVWSDQEHGWIADWQLRHDGDEAAWQIRAVGFDDAFRNGLRGAAQILSGNGLP